MLKKQTQKITKFAAVIALLIFLHFVGILAPIEAFIIQITSPLFSRVYSISSSLRIAYQDNFNKKDLNLLVRQLSDQAKELTAENARLRALEEENEFLRGHLKFLVTSDLKYVMANVVSQGGLDSSLKQNQIIINKGAKDGLYPGLAVVNSQGIIAGKVMNVKDNLADVYLITNKACKIAAALQNKDNKSGIAQGDMGLTIRMEFIPQSEEISAGDIVVASGLEKNIPRGIVIGRVSKVEKESNELWQSAVIEPLADLDELIIVSVLLP